MGLHRKRDLHWMQLLGPRKCRLHSVAVVQRVEVPVGEQVCSDFQRVRRRQMGLPRKWDLHWMQLLGPRKRRLHSVAIVQIDRLYSTEMTVAVVQKHRLCSTEMTVVFVQRCRLYSTEMTVVVVQKDFEVAAEICQMFARY